MTVYMYSRVTASTWMEKQKFYKQIVIALHHQTDCKIIPREP